MKKNIFWMVACATLFFIHAVQARPLHFAMQEYPPFYFQGEKGVTGAAVAVTQQICERLGYVCDFQVLTFSRVLMELQSGEIDGAPGIADDTKRNPERLAFTVFSEPLFHSQTGFLGIEGRVDPLKKTDDLRGWTVGVVRNTYSHNFLQALQQKVPELTVGPENNIVMALKKLQLDHYGLANKSAVFSSIEVALYYAHQIGMNNLTALWIPEEGKKFYAIGFSKKTDAEVIKRFNEQILGMKKNGELKRISLKYEVKAAE